MDCLRKIPSIIIAMLLTITLTSGCGSSGGGSGGSIAYLNFDNSDVFVNIIKTEFEKGASSKGLNVEYFDAKETLIFRLTK